MSTCLKVKGVKHFFGFSSAAELRNNFQAFNLKPWSSTSELQSSKNGSTLMQRQLQVKNSSDEEFEDVNLVFWCLWNGCFPNASRWGIFSLSEEKTRWPLMQVTFSPSRVWMNCLHTIKSMWLIVPASVLFRQRVQTKQICSCMCVYEHAVCVRACIHTGTTVCVWPDLLQRASCWAPRLGYI